jgi:hypothetical protein
VLAANPVLIKSLRGAYAYATTPKDRRDELDIFAQPWVFGFFFIVVLLVVMKGLLPVSGAATTPLDSLAAVGHLAGGVLVLASIIVGPLNSADEHGSAVTESRQDPSTAGLFSVADDDGDASFLPSHTVESDGIVSTAVQVLAYAASIFVYAVVFVVFNCVEAIIVINPLPLVDTALKGFRMTIIGVIVGLSAIHSSLGFIAALFVFLVCLGVFHFCLRLTILSFVYSTGIIRSLLGFTRDVNQDKLRAFSCWHFRGVPWFTHGRIRRAKSGELEFSYKRWFIVWNRTVSVPIETTVAIGTINPYLLGRTEEASEVPLLRFSPHCRGNEAIICECLQIRSVKDFSFQTSLKRAIRLVWDTARGKRQTGVDAVA